MSAGAESSHTVRGKNALSGRETCSSHLGRCFTCFYPAKRRGQNNVGLMLGQCHRRGTILNQHCFNIPSKHQVWTHNPYAVELFVYIFYSFEAGIANANSSFKR